jgi:hypothetical protein
MFDACLINTHFVYGVIVYAFSSSHCFGFFLVQQPQHFFPFFLLQVITINLHFLLQYCPLSHWLLGTLTVVVSKCICARV